MGWAVNRSFSAVAMAAFLLLPCASASAQQTLHQETPEGWFIYREGKSCVLYFDTPRGTMLRFSSRREVNRTYFSAFNEAWSLLGPRLNEGLTIYLNFPKLKRGYGSAGTVVKNVDDRLGITGNSFPVDELNRLMTAEGSMTVKVMFRDNKQAADIEAVNLAGAAVAVNHLAECTEKYFGE